MKNNLIVIENGQLNTYLLDTRVSWEVGRLSKDNTPDIAMHATSCNAPPAAGRANFRIWMEYGSTWITIQRTEPLGMAGSLPGGLTEE